MVQSLPMKQRFVTIEIYRMRNGKKIDTFTSVDLQDIVKIGSKVTEIFEAVLY